MALASRVRDCEKVIWVVFGVVRLEVFFFNDTATTEIYTLSLHDALPISYRGRALQENRARVQLLDDAHRRGDRKSTRLNSSHANISYAVFCLKKKKTRSRQ